MKLDYPLEMPAVEWGIDEHYTLGWTRISTRKSRFEAHICKQSELSQNWRENLEDPSKNWKINHFFIIFLLFYCKIYPKLNISTLVEGGGSMVSQLSSVQSPLLSLCCAWSRGDTHRSEHHTASLLSLYILVG